MSKTTIANRGAFIPNNASCNSLTILAGASSGDGVSYGIHADGTQPRSITNLGTR
jgi:hypothetical protein